MSSSLVYRIINMYIQNYAYNFEYNITYIETQKIVNCFKFFPLFIIMHTFRIAYNSVFYILLYNS